MSDLEIFQCTATTGHCAVFELASAICIRPNNIINYSYLAE